MDVLALLNPWTPIFFLVSVGFLIASTGCGVIALRLGKPVSKLNECESLSSNERWDELEKSFAKQNRWMNWCIVLALLGSVSNFLMLMSHFL